MYASITVVEVRSYSAILTRQTVRQRNVARESFRAECLPRPATRGKGLSVRVHETDRNRFHSGVLEERKCFVDVGFPLVA